MKELAVRTVTSLLFVALLVAAVLWNAYASTGLFFLFSILAGHEYSTHSCEEGERGAFELLLPTLMGSLAFLFLALSFLFELPSLLLGIPLLFPLTLILGLFGKAADPFRSASVRYLPPCYFGLAFASLIGIREIGTGGPYLLLGVLMLIWVHDSAAYLFGKMLGRHKLWPKVSPGKTWEGSIAGALFAFLLSGTLFYTAYPGWSGANSVPYLWLSFPAIVVLLGTLGDLSISKFKRALGIKDTGHILPGHGGVLDRFDALLMSAPFLLFLLGVWNG